MMIKSPQGINIVYSSEQSKIKIGKSTITGNDLLGLINYNEMLMKRCGPNLENCMIKDTGDDVYDE